MQNAHNSWQFTRYAKKIHSIIKNKYTKLYNYKINILMQQ